MVTDFDCFVVLPPLLLFAKASPPHEMAHMHARRIARKEDLNGKAHWNLDTLASLYEFRGLHHVIALLEQVDSVSIRKRGRRALFDGNAT